MDDDISFAFACTGCGRKVAAFQEHIGQSISCPVCQAEFTVPRPSWARKNHPELNPEFPRIFGPEELNLVAGMDGGVRQCLVGATNRNCWEFVLLAGLIRARLTPLREMLVRFGEQDSTATRGLSRLEAGYEQAFDSVSQRLLEACRGLHPVLTDMLEPAMYGDHVAYTSKFADGLVGPVLMACAAYGELIQQPVPPDYPYANMVYVLKGWAYHIWETLDRLAARLEESAAAPPPKPLPQVTVVPVSIHEFQVLRSRVPQA